MISIYKIAGRNIAVSSLYDEVHHLCRDYISPSAVPDFMVETTREDIDFERERSARADEALGREIRPFSDGYLETLAVYRKIAEKMPDYGTILFHGSCVAVDGVGYLFTARSGTGKSTHTRLWRELLGERAQMVNDDKPLIRPTPSGTVIYGTPWDGKHHLSRNTCVPLKAVCILERSDVNRIRRISSGEAYPMLVGQAYRPMDQRAMGRTLDLIDQLSDSVSFWKLGCNTEIEAAITSYEAMKG